MSNDKPRFIEKGDPDDSPMPFPTFICYAKPPTYEQLSRAKRRREVDAVFGFYKLKLSKTDNEKIEEYLNNETSLEYLINRFKTAT
ncbi:hypothetical protein [Pseudomonas sp. M47T1]|uniref:hypothetical protein n=1 Tax=Pseudomonas sp. M47T1 TaxID=1179778 RepID=UPI0012F823A7|nr:hypothetical protein [Pseudomonas sp. M47T1]